MIINMFINTIVAYLDMPILEFIKHGAFCRYKDLQIPVKYAELQAKTKQQKPVLSEVFRLLLVSFLGEYALWIFKETHCSHQELMGTRGVLDQMATIVASEFTISKVIAYQIIS